VEEDSSVGPAMYFVLHYPLFHKTAVFGSKFFSLLFFTSLFSYISPPPTFPSFSLLTLPSSHPSLICILFLYFIFIFLANVLTTISPSLHQIGPRSFAAA